MFEASETMPWYTGWHIKITKDSASEKNVGPSLRESIDTDSLLSGVTVLDVIFVFIIIIVIQSFDCSFQLLLILYLK